MFCRGLLVAGCLLQRAEPAAPVPSTGLGASSPDSLATRPQVSESILRRSLPTGVSARSAARSPCLSSSFGDLQPQARARDQRGGWIPFQGEGRKGERDGSSEPGGLPGGGGSPSRFPLPLFSLLLDTQPVVLLRGSSAPFLPSCPPPSGACLCLSLTPFPVSVSFCLNVPSHLYVSPHVSLPVSLGFCLSHPLRASQ